MKITYDSEVPPDAITLCLSRNSLIISVPEIITFQATGPISQGGEDGETAGRGSGSAQPAGTPGREGGRVTRASGASARAKPKALKLGSAAGGSVYRPKGTDLLRDQPRLFSCVYS